MQKRLLSLFLGLCLGITSLLAQTYLPSTFTNAGNPGSLNLEGDAPGQNAWLTIQTGNQAANIWSPVNNIPFPFSFYGQPVSQFKASLNGVVTFDVGSTTLPGPNTNLPTASIPDQSICVFWDEFTAAAPTGGNDEIRTKIFGTAPNRQFWIKWYSFEIGNPTVSFTYVALVLEESSNKVYVVDQWSNAATPNTSTVGVQLNATTAVQIGGSNISLAGNGNTEPDNDYYEFLPISGAADDILTYGIVAPEDNGCGSTADSVTIGIRNVGTNPASGIQVTYILDGGTPVGPETVPGTINPGDSLQYTFSVPADLSAVGPHTIFAGASLVGDGDNSNDTLTVVLTTIGALPTPLLPVDFTSYNGGNIDLLFPGWREASGNPTPLGNVSAWGEDDFANNPANPNGSAARITLSAASDEEWIISPKFNPDTNSVVIYDLAMTANFNGAPSTFGSDDFFQVRISTDCGETFTALRTYTNATPISNTGQTDTVDLGAYAGQDVFLAFYASEGSINDPGAAALFLDNIQVSKLLAVDLGVTEIVAPVNASCFGSNETVVVRIQNFGVAPVDFSVHNVNVFTAVSGANTGLYSTLIDTGSLALGASMLVTVSNTVDLTTPGINTLSAYTSNPDDTNLLNDSTIAELETSPTINAPFLEDFEAFTNAGTSSTTPGFLANGWTRDFTGSVGWHVGADGAQYSVGTGPIDDHTPNGINYMYTETSVPAQVGDTFLLISPCIDLGNLMNPYMVFWYHMFGPDMGTLEVDILANDTLTNVFSLSGPQQTAETEAWIPDTTELNNYLGQTIQLIFRGIRGTDFTSDMAIDDVGVFERSPIDLEPLALVNPTGLGCFSGNEDVIVRIGNTGTDTVQFANNNATIDVGILGPILTTYSTTVNTGSLSPGDSLEVIVTNAGNFATFGIYDMTISVSTLADANTINDTLKDEVTQNITFPTPYTEDFETFISSPNANDPGSLSIGWTRNFEGAVGWHVGQDGAGYSVGTGPIDDHTNGGSNYMYVETSVPAVPGEVFELYSPCIDLSNLSLPGLSFWYHMFGADMGTLEVGIVSGGVEDTVFSISGPQQNAETDAWTQAIVPLLNYSGTISLVFRGIRGNDFTSDMAIDDINIFDLPPYDLAVIDLVDPTDPGCLSNSNPIEVLLENQGSDTLNFAVDTATINVDITGPVNNNYSLELNSGIIPPFGSASYVVTTNANLGVAGTYDISIIGMIDGDASNLNDTLLTSRTQITPLIPTLAPVTFDGYNGGNLPTVFPGWSEAEGTTIPVLGGSTWTDDTYGNNAGSPNGVAARLRVNANTDDDWLVGPKFLADSNTFVCYDVALTLANQTGGSLFGSDDFLSVMISTDCGGSYSPIFTYSNTTVVPPPTGQTDTLSLAAYDGQEVIIAFYASEGTVDDPEALDLFLDNIFIKKVIESDVKVVSIEGPESDCGLGTNEVVRIRVANLGTDPVTTVEAQYAIDGQAFSTPETLPAGIAPGDTIDYFFIAPGDFSGLGAHEITAVATSTSPADLNVANDSLRATITTIPVISTYPYQQDFENGTEGWLSTGENNSWAFGTPAKNIINSAASGSNAWVVGGLVGEYGPNESSAVQSPCFDMSNIPSGAWVSMSIWWETETSWDGVVLQSSIDGGQTWNNVGAFGDPFNWYNDNTIDADPGDQQEGWTGILADGEGSNGWVQAKHPLDISLIGQANVRFRVAFASDGFVNEEGFAFDDFVIGVPPRVDLGADTSACGSLVLDAGGGIGLSYEWSTGDTSQTISLSNATASPQQSIIFVTVTDSVGLCGTDTISVSIATTTPAVTAMVMDSISCNADSSGTLVATGSGGLAPYTYRWNSVPPQIGPTASMLSAGSYTVTISDEFNCEATANAVLSEPLPIGVALDSLLQNDCPDDSIGGIFLSVGGGGGLAPYTYLWSNGDTTQDITDLPVGMYTGTITDANGCQISESFMLGAQDTFPVAAFDFMPVGSTINFNSLSTNTTSYLWDFGDGNTSTSTNPTYVFATNDTFIVTLTATNDCGMSVLSDTIVITQVGIEEEWLSQQIGLYPNPNQGSFELHFDNLQLKAIRLRVHNLAGQIVHQDLIQQVNGNYVHPMKLPSNLSEGVYLLEIATEEAVIHKRFVLK
ncbi:MAG: choice-of-anchor J domain-containing protein [Bacteroidota bacterium]